MKVFSLARQQGKFFDPYFPYITSQLCSWLGETECAREKKQKQEVAGLRSPEGRETRPHRLSFLPSLTCAGGGNYMFSHISFLLNENRISVTSLAWNNPAFHIHSESL